MTTLSLSDTRKNLSQLINGVQKNGDQFAITVNGTTAATVLSQDDYESLIETIEILQDNELLQDIATAEEQYQKGEVITLDELKKEYAKESASGYSNLKG